MPASPTPPSLPAPRATRGFSLVELMIATAIGAALLVALAAAAHLFTAQLDEVRSGGGDAGIDRALETVTRAARYGWSVQSPDASTLQVTDPYGDRTDFYLQDDELRQRRPDGQVGTLCSGIASLAFGVQTTQRLRELAPATAIRTVWTAPATGTTASLTLKAGDQIALGFTLPVDAASSYDSVNGVSEQRTGATLHRLLLPCAWLDGGDKSLCHLHATQPHNPSHPSGQGVLTIRLYEARVPGEARPSGAALGTVNVSMGSLPAASYTWWDSVTHASVNPPNGVAWGWWDNHPTVVLNTTTPVSASSFDLSGMHAALQPGRGYTLVLSLSGYDQLTLQTRSLASSRLSGMALQLSPATSLVPQARSVTCAIEANETVTQTQALDVVTSVAVEVGFQDGRSRSVSTNVAGQEAVDDPWLGAAPGDLPELELEGS